MSTVTTNYKLIKPELTDAADITATNENWDTIDGKLKDALNGRLESVLAIAKGGHGSTTQSGALKNLSGLTSLTGNIPATMPLIYANMLNTGVVSASCTTKEYCMAMQNYQMVTFVHNAENSVRLTDALFDYGVCTLFRGYNNNYLVGLFIGVNGEMYKFKSHENNTANEGWTPLNRDGVKTATVV
jgi:hypothetical protein